MAAPLRAGSLGVVAEIERSLARQRCGDDDRGELRASTMTHVVWCPPSWLPEARRTLAGLAERHPARTIFLVPERGREPAVEGRAEVKRFEIPGSSRSVASEVIEVRLRGPAAQHPASVVLPLLLSDLPAFCRWRGAPAWGSDALADIARVCDRLVVDSAEWAAVRDGLGELCGLFPRVAVSDIAFARSLAWRARLADLWPEISGIERLRVEGPQADALLLAGWLRARLRREVRLSRRASESLTRVVVDGNEVDPPSADAPSGSELLSSELDRHGRDPVYEAAARAAMKP